MSAALPLPGAGSVLKPIAKYLQQAKQIEKVDPVIAYYCRLYALQQGMKIKDRSADDTRLIGEVMSAVESKQSLVRGLSKEDARARCEAFALQVFEHGDTEDRAGVATKSTALSFHAAYVLMDTCRQFGPLASDLEEKQKYAIVKAADINKALKEGRKPKAGPLNEPGPEDDMGDAGGQGGAMLADGSGSSSMAAAPSVAPHFSTAATPFTGASGGGWPASMQGGGGGGAPSSSASPSFNPHAASSSSASSYPSAAAYPMASPSDLAGMPFATSASAPPAAVSGLAMPTGTLGQQPPQPQSSQFGNRPAAAPPAASAKPASASASGSSPFSAEAIASRAAASGGGGFTRIDTRRSDAVREGERLIKHALSAVVFSDVDTTCQKLREALALLQPFTTTAGR